jgi:hypothetical protein
MVSVYLTARVQSLKDAGDGKDGLGMTEDALSGVC